MSHNLATGSNGQKVFASFRKSAWHRLGTVFQEPVAALEGWNNVLESPYSVAKLPLRWPGEIDAKMWGICKVSIDDSNMSCFGTVSENYELVTPEQFCEAWDMAGEIAGKLSGKKWHIETMGALGNGEKFWLLSKMPDVEICNEEHNQYMLGVNDMTGKGANLLRLTDVRVVCQNTMNAALRDMESTFKVNHNSEVMASMVKWIVDVLETVEQKSTAVKEAMELFAETRFDNELLTQGLKVAMPVSSQPRKSGSPLYDAKKLEEWEKRNVVAVARQEVVRDLYNGGMTGFSNQLVRGTGYGFYCAVTEAVDHVIAGRGEDSSNETFVTGWRNTVKDNTFKWLMDVCKN